MLFLRVFFALGMALPILVAATPFLHPARPMGPAQLLEKRQTDDGDDLETDAATDPLRDGKQSSSLSSALGDANTTGSGQLQKHFLQPAYRDIFRRLDGGTASQCKARCNINSVPRNQWRGITARYKGARDSVRC